MSNMYQSLSHSKWDCKYHIVFVPKYRKKVIFGNIRKSLGPIFHKLARQKECLLNVNYFGLFQAFGEAVKPLNLQMLSPCLYRHHW